MGSLRGTGTLTGLHNNILGSGSHYSDTATVTRIGSNSTSSSSRPGPSVRVRSAYNGPPQYNQPFQQQPFQNYNNNNNPQYFQSQAPLSQQPFPQQPTHFQQQAPVQGSFGTPSPFMPGVEGEAAVFWDFENCAVPWSVDCGSVARRLRDFAKQFGCVRALKAYAKTDALMSRMSELLGNGVEVVPVAAGKEMADKAIIMDALLFALDALHRSNGTNRWSASHTHVPAMYMLFQHQCCATREPRCCWPCRANGASSTGEALFTQLGQHHL